MLVLMFGKWVDERVFDICHTFSFFLLDMHQNKVKTKTVFVAQRHLYAECFQQYDWMLQRNITTSSLSIYMWGHAAVFGKVSFTSPVLLWLLKIFKLYKWLKLTRIGGFVRILIDNSNVDNISHKPDLSN